MAAEKEKKLKVSEQIEGEQSEPVDKEIVQSIERLQEIQDELDKINEEANDKVLEVEQSFIEIRKPIYIRRNEVIQSIQDFWLTAFLSHPALGNLITEEDQKILKYMVSLEVDESKDVKSGYSIIFNFSPNPYFEDEKLVKTYSFIEDGALNINCTQMKWKEGKDVLNGNSNQKKGTKRPFNEESFFSWFSESQTKDEQQAEIDEVAEIIKEDLWPNPLRHFQNEVDAYYEEEDAEEEDGDDDENEED